MPPCQGGRIVARSRARWARMTVLFRADSGFARQGPMTGCRHRA